MAAKKSAKSGRPSKTSKSKKTASFRDRTAKRLDAFRILGPGGGGTIIEPVVSPHDPDVVVMRSDMTDGFVTYDGGQSWREFNLCSGLSCFAWDASDENTLYVGNYALWRSRDKAKSFEMIWPDPKNTVVHRRTDDGDWILSSNDPSYPPLPGVNILCVHVAPADSDHILLTCQDITYIFGEKAASYLMESRDDGRSWRRIDKIVREAFHNIFIDGKTLCVAGRAGIYRYTNGQRELLPAPQGSKIVGTCIGKVNKSGKATLLYAVTEPTSGEHYARAKDMHVSTDGGRTWTSIGQGALSQLPNAGSLGFSSVACSAYAAKNVYVGYGTRVYGDETKPFIGIARSSDGGKTWEIVLKEDGYPTANFQGSYLEPRMPVGVDVFYDAARGLSVSATDPDVCYGSDCFRIYGTKDGGATWKQMHSTHKGNDFYTSRGMDVLTCYGIHFDPFDRKHMFISFTDMGLHHSYDGGESWAQAHGSGIPEYWRNTCYWMEFDPMAKGVAWAGFAGTHDLPRPRMWRGKESVWHFRGGMAMTTDGGLTWQRWAESMPEVPITHVLVDPESPVGKRTIYAAGFGRGLYKSTDNGKTWQLKNNGVDGKEPFAWRIIREKSGTLYLVCARRSEDGEINDWKDGALYRSTDGAESWTKLPLLEGTNGPNGLCIDPDNSQRLYLAAWGRSCLPAGDFGGGIFLSEDGGQHWMCVHRRYQHVYDITCDTRKGKVLYACGWDSFVMRSEDAGLTWKRIPGFNFKPGHRLIPDPYDASKIYIITMGSSVWHGPATGDPKRREDGMPTLPEAP